ncbi:hypothetical protein ILUMI_00493 [Ignelater luminosus]|uniref:Protein sleepless n=1 Tax=Ignelater luminosus TaxID=2038154 RepID=A0A8K0GQ63_IGNLU|nr:hypothetical protein ILUMI_00493 [Ignelater luminosus]
MMRFISTVTFSLLLFFRISLNYRCYHCRKTQYGSCIHPMSYYPPVAYCGALGSWCGKVNIGLVYKEGSPTISYGDGSRWAIFKGCVTSNYCLDFENDTLKKKFEVVGANFSSCNICSEELCNSVNSNLSLCGFVKLFVVEVAAVFIMYQVF